MIKISDKIYYLPHCNESGRPTMGYIKGTKHSLMIDSGSSHRHVTEYLSELDKEQFPHPNFVAVTHWHFDHTYGLSALSIPVIACNNTNAKLKQMRNWKWDENSMEERVVNLSEPKACQERIKKEYSDLSLIKIKTADIVFDKHLTLDLGEVTCDMICTESSHTDDCVLFFIPEEKVIFVGDAGYSNSTEQGHTYEKKKLKKFIELLEALDFDTLVNGHWSHESRASALSDYYEILEEL
jgi:glyoxylase-like metal-dependent hydrolase (beta-lactamase superfamily II)